MSLKRFTPGSNKEYKVKLGRKLNCSICPPNRGCNDKRTGSNLKWGKSKPKGKR